MVLDTGLRYDQLENLSDEELCALGRAGRRQAEDVLATRYHWLGSVPVPVRIFSSAATLRT